MTTPKEVFVGIDVAKLRNAVAIADAGRDGEIRYIGEFDASPENMTRLIRKLAAKHDKLHFCYEAGPTGYGLYRQIVARGMSALSWPHRSSRGGRVIGSKPTDAMRSPWRA